MHPSVSMIQQSVESFKHDSLIKPTHSTHTIHNWFHLKSSHDHMARQYKKKHLCLKRTSMEPYF